MVSIAYLFLIFVAAASAAPESRVVGGSHVTIEEFPYVVAYTYYYPGPGITVQRCVGALISSWHVMTSAFCYHGAILSNMQIRAGSTSSLSGGTLVNIRDVVKHPDYTYSPRSNDLAVTFLATPLGITNVIGILYLPAQNTYIADGQAMKIVSWGFESEAGPQLETLKTVTLNKLGIDQCAEAFEDIEEVAVSDSVICASSTTSAMCSGSSGAPMVIGNVVVGGFSTFVSCDSTYPDVFTRIDRYTNWILGVASSTRGGQDLPRVAPITA